MHPIDNSVYSSAEDDSSEERGFLVFGSASNIN